MLCLLLSGMAGLVYEIVWTRYLALFLGHTSYAVIAVLVAFMGGLAVGNLWIGVWADRTRRPLASYAWLEIAIGVYALIFPIHYQLCYSGFLGLARSLDPGSAGLLALKFLFSLLAILIPTVLMGGTLPLLTRLLTRSLGEMREKVAALYFINSAGGVIGIWLADFWWIGAIGLPATLMVGAVLNLAVGGLALFVSGYIKEGQADQDEATTRLADTPRPEAEPESYGPVELRLAILGIGLSGFVAMLYQVAWTRLLALAMGSSTHAFSLMLITFITGLTVGAWIVYRWRSLRRSLAAFAWAELALALTVGVSLFFYEFLPYWFGRLADLLARRPEAYSLYQGLQGLLCFAVMFVPTVCLGMTLPLVTRAATPSLERAGRTVGRVFAVNTVGTVLGAALTGLVLMPRLGLAGTFVLGVAVNLLIGLVIVVRVERGAKRLIAIGASGLFVVFLAASTPFLARYWQNALTLGVFRPRGLATNWRDYHKGLQEGKPLFYRDGAGATVSVHTGENPETDLYLKVNAKTDASTLGDMTTQLLSGHLPLLLHPESTNVLVIGLGSGVTAGAIAAHSSVQTIDVVEISPEVVEASRLFNPYNRDVFRDPRVRLVIDDAKSYLLLNPRRYQTIISEPSNPWMAGVAGVFTLEFYEECRAHLDPGGVMVQWVQLYEFSDTGLETVVATFSQVFPHVSIWHTDAADILLIGTVEPRSSDLAAFAARLDEPSVKADLERIKLTNMPLLLSHELISSAHGALLPPIETRIHSDYYPTLEYLAQRDFFVRHGATRFRQIDENFSRRPTTLLGDYLRANALTWADFEAFANTYLESGKPFLDIITSVLLRWQQQFPEAWEPLEVASRFVFVNAPGELDVLRLAPLRDGLIDRARVKPDLLRQYGLALMRTYSEQRSAFYAPPTEELTAILDRLIELDPDNQRVYQVYLAELAWDRGDDDLCLDYGRRAMTADLPRGSAKFKLDPVAPLRVVARLADVMRRRGELVQAAELCETAVRGGYLTDSARAGALIFEVTQRRVQAELNQLATRRAL